MSSELYRLLSHTAVSDLPVVIAPVLRIVKKCVVQDLEKVIIDHVKSAWPTSLEEWSKYALRPRDFRFTDAMYEPVAAFLFAIEHNVPEMLPATFYQITISEVTTWQYEDSDWKRYIDKAETARSTTSALGYAKQEPVHGRVSLGPKSTRRRPLPCPLEFRAHWLMPAMLS